VREPVVDDELMFHDIFGTIAYQGKGVFIAGGAGIHPFISICLDFLHNFSLSHFNNILVFFK
jgi:predicted ferric reductase